MKKPKKVYCLRLNSDICVESFWLLEFDKESELEKYLNNKGFENHYGNIFILNKKDFSVTATKSSYYTVGGVILWKNISI